LTNTERKYYSSKWDYHPSTEGPSLACNERNNWKENTIWQCVYLHFRTVIPVAHILHSVLALLLYHRRQKEISQDGWNRAWNVRHPSSLGT